MLCILQARLGWQVRLMTYLLLKRKSLFASAAANTVSTFSFGTVFVALLANMSPWVVGILTAFAARRTLPSVVPIPAELGVAIRNAIFRHALVAAVAVETKI